MMFYVVITTKKANGITKDLKTDTLCHTIAIYQGEDGFTKHYFSMKDDSKALQSSRLYQTIMVLIEPYESLKIKMHNKVEVSGLSQFMETM